MHDDNAPMPTRRTMTLALLSTLALPPWARAAAVVVEGRRFEDAAHLFGRDLVLNGTGVRAVAWFKGYAAGLYLATRTQAAAEAVAMAGPKRIRLQMLQDAPATEFTKAVDKGVSRNTPAAELPALLERMQQFGRLIGAIGQVRKGDMVDLDLDPDRGLLLRLNGTLRGTPIPGTDLYASLLRSFIGERPYDEKLKAGLLGRPV
jgi:Chalcone isomerase-like